MSDLAASAEREEYPLRMKDLCERTGLPRQVIHFYIQQGLVPEGKKTGRNMAFYREEHVQRIQLIRQLQHERFLPLKAIRAMLTEQEGAFSPAQRRLLAEVKSRLAPSPLVGTVNSGSVLAEEALQKCGVSSEDLADMVEIGVLGASEDAQGRTVLSQDDLWLLELWGELRAAGFTKELGFSAKDLSFLEDVMSQLFQREAELMATRLSSLPADRVAEMVEKALPVLHTLVARYHASKIRNFLATVG